MSEKKKTVILVSYLIFLCAACISLIFIRESAELNAKKSITDLNFRIASLEAEAQDLQTLILSVRDELDEENIPAAAEKKYIIKENGEKIGIFSSSGKLLYEIDVYVRTLPQSDRELLRRGIELGSIKEIYSLIQDYCS